MSNLEWSTYQTTIFQETKHNDANLSVQAVAGSGKCLQEGTLVIMADGSLKPVQDVLVGESVMGPDSLCREVLSTTNGTSQMYKIIPVKGDPWVCNNEHILTLVTSNRNRVFDLHIQDYLNGTSHSKFHPKNNYTNAKLFRVPLSFQEKEIFVDPYLLGVWLGDGNSNDTIIYLTEKEVYDAIAPKMRQHSIDYFQLTGNGSCLKVSMRTEENANPLRKYLRNKCKVNSNKTIPFEYLTNSEYVRLEVLAGLIDTDGDYSGTYSITTKFETLRDDILYLCRSLGFAAYSSIKIVKGKEYYRISISGHLERVPVRLSYKKASPRQQIKNVLRTGFSVEDAGVGDYYGFTLSGDGRFVLGDFTVTHNSTTLFEIANRCSGNVLFLAFNKMIADYAKGKMGADVDCRTFHSYGLSLLKQEIGWYPKVDTNKVYDCVKKRHPYVKGEWNPRKPLNRIIKRMRALGFMSYNEEDIHEWLIDNDGVFSYNIKERAKEEAWAFKNISEIETVLRHLDEKPVRQEKNEDDVEVYPTYRTIIDFDDMVRYPCVYNLASRKRVYCNVVLVDEAQDMNPYQIHLINQLFKKDVRTICVGDKFQAIYAFRGSYSDSMERLVKMTNALELPLSVTYRCCSNIVDFTNNEIVGSEMVHFKTGGEVKKIYKSEFITYVKEHNVPMIIGAKNKNLIKAWLELAKAKIGSTLKDKGIVQEIRRVLNDFNVEEKGIEQMVEGIDDTLWKGLYTDDAGNQQQSLSNTVVELYGCVKEIVSSPEFAIETYDDFVDLLNEMEKDSNHELHTVHSSKGLEAHSVIVLGDWFQSEQSENMKYVAYTRAEDLLLLIEDWEKEEDEKSDP